ncbi:MAG: ribonuclease P protein component [Rikenellaceae bacterium]
MINEELDIESCEAAVVDDTAAAKRTSTLSLAKPNGLPRCERLRGRTAVSHLFAEGDGGFVFPIKYIYCKGSDATAVTSVMFTVPKRFHKRANKRNLLRRRIKEAYRLQKGLLGAAGSGYHIALIYSHKEASEYRKIAGAVEKILLRIGAAE